MFFESSALWDAMTGRMTFFLREGKAASLGVRVKGLGFRGLGVWGLGFRV